jgi:hypothetical protein
MNDQTLLAPIRCTFCEKEDTHTPEESVRVHLVGSITPGKLGMRIAAPLFHIFQRVRHVPMLREKHRQPHLVGATSVCCQDRILQRAKGPRSDARSCWRDCSHAAGGPAALYELRKKNWRSHRITKPGVPRPTGATQ